jgi:hypothetical protein
MNTLRRRAAALHRPRGHAAEQQGRNLAAREAGLLGAQLGISARIDQGEVGVAGRRSCCASTSLARLSSASASFPASRRGWCCGQGNTELGGQAGDQYLVEERWKVGFLRTEDVGQHDLGHVRMQAPLGDAKRMPPPARRHPTPLPSTGPTATGRHGEVGHRFRRQPAKAACPVAKFHGWTDSSASRVVGYRLAAISASAVPSSNEVWCRRRS